MWFGIVVGALSGVAMSISFGEKPFTHYPLGVVGGKIAGVIGAVIIGPLCVIWLASDGKWPESIVGSVFLAGIMTYGIAANCLLAWVILNSIIEHFTLKRFGISLGGTFGVVLAIAVMVIWDRKIMAAAIPVLIFLSGIVFIKAIRGENWGGVVTNLIGTAFAIGMIYLVKAGTEGPLESSIGAISVCAVYYAFTRKIPDVWKEPDYEP